MSLMFRCDHSDEYVRPPPRPLVRMAQNKMPTDPQQVHISSVGTNNMRVSWITDDQTVASVVEYGTSQGGKYTASAKGSQTTYRYSSYQSGAIHNVTIGPLKPSTTYYYRCGKAGEELSLRTPPANLPMEFVVIGDLGQTEWTDSTLSHIGDADYDMLLLPGDLSYADTDQTLWDSFGNLVQPLASARPWIVTEGNHEIEAHKHEPMFVAYNNRWRMPYEESGSKSNLYYSLDAAGGAAHVVMLGSYARFDKGSEQHAWLKRDLAGVDRRKTPWLVVVLHVPWYSTNEAHQGEGDRMRAAMESLLYEARVDIVFAGHVHAYERFVICLFYSPSCFSTIHIQLINHAFFFWPRRGSTTTRPIARVRYTSPSAMAATGKALLPNSKRITSWPPFRCSGRRALGTGDSRSSTRQVPSGSGTATTTSTSLCATRSVWRAWLVKSRRP